MREVQKQALLRQAQAWFKETSRPGDRLIMLCLHGSHLYGTASESSDIDIRGVYIPDVSDVLMGNFERQYSFEPEKVKGTPNSPGDVEIKVESIQRFMQFLSQGEPVAIEMLHSTFKDGSLLFTSLIWESTRNHMSTNFCSKKMGAFVGYCLDQVDKFKKKGKRLAALNAVHETVKDLPGWHDNRLAVRFWECFNQLPVNEHCFFIDRNKEQFYSILDKQYPGTIRLEDFKAVVEELHKSYGARSNLTKESGFVDWKSMYNAVRIISQLKEIYLTGSLKFPLSNAKDLLEIKKGRRDFEEVNQTLQELVQEVRGLAESPSHPDSIDPSRAMYHVLRCYASSLWVFPKVGALANRLGIQMQKDHPSFHQDGLAFP